MRQGLIGAMFFSLGFPVWASENVYSGFSSELLFRLANFGIFLLVIIFSARKVVKLYLQRRRDSISGRLQAAHAALAEADRKLAEMKERMDNSEQEVALIRERLLQETEREEREIIQAAKQSVDRLIESSQKLMIFEKEKLLQAIKEEVVAAVMTEALGQLKSKMTTVSDEAWIQRQIDRNEGSSGSSGRNATTA